MKYSAYTPVHKKKGYKVLYMVFNRDKTHLEWSLEKLGDCIKQCYKSMERDEAKLKTECAKLFSRYAPTVNLSGISGIYAITVDDKIMYVGQSMLIHERILTHICEITDCIKKRMLGEHIEKKYNLLATAVMTEHKLEFIVLCECNRDKKELNEKEFYYMNLYSAPLNTYRPKRHTVPDTLEEALEVAFIV